MIKTRIWEIRTKQGITLTKLSELSGIGKSALNYYENGKRSPRIAHLELIAKALNVHFVDTLCLFDEHISTYVEIVSKGISNSPDMLYNSSIKRLNEEEQGTMDRDILIEAIYSLIKNIRNNNSLMRIYNLANYLFRNEKAN